MKNNIKNYSQFVKAFAFAGLLATSAGSFAQRASVSADTKLGTITLTDDFGAAIDANNVNTDNVVKLKVPVISDNHGKAIPAGSAKIKIGLGSKLVLDPTFSINNVELSNYFAWTVAENGGQLQITGNLVNPLPANVTDITLSFKVKATELGSSAITANFLITNHNTAVILSDENGANNAASLEYNVTNKGQVVTPLGEAGNIVMYPNPVANNRTVIIEAKQGAFKGKYTLVMFDATGKKVQNNAIELNGVTNFKYNVGNIASGKYILQLLKDEAAKPVLLKFVKL